jgi:hypothetical protein
MATLKFLTEADQQTSDEIRDLVERLRGVFRADTSDAVWSCWASMGAHGMTVRLQQTRRVAPYGARADGPTVTYSGGGTADFLVDDISVWLQAQAGPQSAAAETGQRRRASGRRRRGDSGTR